MAIIAHASIDEHNKAKGGLAGDQTGKEVCTRKWYNKPWGCVIRFIDPDMREKVARCMEMAAANPHIGYDQNQRNTLLNLARKYNYDVGRVTQDCETDCSALVSVACMYAGIPESRLTLNGNCATTRTLKAILKSTGEVDIYTTSTYTASTERLLRGDILLKEGSHVAVVVQADAKKPVSVVAREVIRGDWGNGAQRKKALEDAGYSYDEVRQAVNALIKSNK